MMRRDTYNNIVVATRLLSLVVLMAFGAGLKGWGQTTFPDVAIGQSEEIRYVIDNTDYEIKLQRAGLRDNLNAYIHWYKEGSSSASLSSSDLSRNSDGSYSWSGLGNAPAGRITYRNSNVQNTDNDVLVCKATSIQNGRMTMVRRYLIQEASDREEELDKARTNAINAGWDVDNVEDLDINKIDQLKANFFESYEIHTPMESGTSYRLAEVLNNYIVEYTTTTGYPWDPTETTTLQYPNQVRWRVYDSNGKLKKSSSGNGGYYNYTTRNNNTKNHTTYVTDGYVVFSMDNYDEESYPNLPNIFSYYYPYDESKKDEQQVFYLTAEVSYEGQKWYPVSFLTVYLEPNSETLTQDDLDDIEDYPDNVNYRRTSKYLSEPRFRSLGSVTFDGNNTSLPTGADENYPTFEELSEILKASSYYAFAAPRYHKSRRGENRFVGSGEYGLYKTLGFDNISPQNKTVGGYNNIYYSNYALETYKVKVADRLHETDNSKYGYFFYLDAAEEPGIITKINLGNSLCPNTRIIVTAWVCNLQTTDSNNDGSLNADIGLTFKGVLNDKETILTKFYSGEIKNNPAETEGEFTEFAKWQQVYFEFDYNSQVEYQDYILEVANNCRHAHGADYAIDDIQVWRSTPDIRVQRRDACDASSLVVSSVYNTVLSNMGWNEGQDVLAGYSTDELNTNMDLRKYRYGLNGDYNDSEPAFQTSSTVGNVYFAFMDGIGNADKSLSDIKWIVINKDLDFETHPGLEPAAKSMRFVVSTDININGFPTSEGEAIAAERTLNLRAIDDYNADVEDGKWNDKGYSKIIVDTNEDGTVSDEEYHTAIETLYEELQIPRIRCPWKEQLSDGSYMLYMTTLDVYETELKYMGEDDGTENGASGQYEVIVFSAAQIVETTLSIDECSLISPFTVLPATTITIKTALGEPETAACAGSLRRITAKLNGYDVDGNIVDLESKGIKYLFDWYLGSMDSYIEDSLEHVDQSNASIKQIIEAYRGDRNDNDNITIDELEKWNGNGAYRLIDLIKSGLLLTGKEGGNTFDLELPDTDRIVAMPYVYSNTSSENYTFCTWKTELSLPVEELDIPLISTGFPGITYPFDESAPLRLGLRNMIRETELSIPIGTQNLSMAEGAHHLGVNGTPDLSFREETSATLTKVGTVMSLYIPKDYKDKTNPMATMTVKWDAKATTLFKEGQEYELLFPFVQYKNDDEILSSQCDGLASLTIKVVPEYLTWQGTTGTEVWYKDGNWHQSTEEELYMNDKTPDQDANGDDVITNAFAPLYFTKITIPDGKQLTLDEPEKNDVNDIVLDFGDKNNVATANIQYDMAVDNTGADGSIEVVPYYINKVEQIYFKPEATLMNQHYLLYDTARVEFTMKQNTPYWMASPLKRVYAGDLYAPTGGTQNTQAFNHIVFNETKYDRWGPAFYQKAWNKAVAYMDSDEKTVSHDSNNAIDVSAVKSNWSIEYNDVWVPYPIGKGFYASVEGVADGGEVTVRLPKADTEYLYYQTKAANNLSPEPEFSDGRRRITDENGVVTGGAGQLATEKPTFTRNENFEFSYSSNGNVTLNLDDVYGESSTDVESGEQRHFLVGNPYMTYLDMEKFFEVNNDNLEKKFWTLVRNGTSVGTPDVTVWSEANGYHDHTDKTAQSYVAPMTAFFVELNKDATTKTIKFTTAMMAAKPTTTDNVYTKSYSASNPILTLTAERGETRSVARLLTSDKGHDEYEASEDAVLLLDSELDAPMVYTVAGDVAAQFNTLRSIKNVPLGIYNKKGDEVTLTISGLSRLVEPLYLYDAWTGKSKELTGDSYQLTVEGESLGRYYLRNEALASELESTISIYSLQPGEIVAASSGAALRQVRVYSVNGELVTQRSAVGQTACRLSVPRGAIYMIYAEDTKGNSQSVKLRVR